LTLAGPVALVVHQSGAGNSSGHFRSKVISSADKVERVFHVDINFCSDELRVVAGDYAQKLLDFLAKRKSLINILMQGVEAF
jgi:hypothetical protein